MSAADRKRPPRRRYRKLLVVAPTAAAVDCIATPQKRQRALARRMVQQRLQWHGGMTKREAEAIVRAMPMRELLAALPWWRRLYLAITKRIETWTTRR